MKSLKSFVIIMNKQEELNKSYNISPEKYGKEWEDPIFRANVFLNDMYVEIAELIESLYFKHWSKEFRNQEVEFYQFKNKENVFIELVDILHFLMSVYIEVKNVFNLTEQEITLSFISNLEQFEKKENGIITIKNNFDNVNQLIKIVSDINYFINFQFNKYCYLSKDETDKIELTAYFSYLIKTYFDFLDVCENFGFSLDKIYEGYMEKNKVNHQRRENGYSQNKKNEKDNEEIIKKVL